jgi:DNA-binding MarR family transcriptional regulator
MLGEEPLEATSHDARVFSARALITLAETGMAATQVIDEIDPQESLGDNARMLVALHLWLSGPMRPSEIASLLGMTTGGSTKIVQKLEKLGLVSKQADAEDGRVVIVALTAKGRNAVEDATEALVPVMERAVNHLEALRILAE